MKGFTLVEILGVLIVVGIISVITFTVIDNSLNNATNKTYETQLENIKKAAESYVVDPKNYDSLPQNDGETITLTLGQLQDLGYIEVDINNPKTDKPFESTLEVIITKNAEYDPYTYEIDESTIK